MKKMIVMGALGLACATATASDWQLFSAGPLKSHYVDRASIIKKGRFVQSWSRTNYSKPQGYTGPIGQAPGDGAPYRSVLMLAQFNCEERESYITNALYFDGLDGEGKTVFSDSVPSRARPEFTPVLPDSIGEEWMDYVCAAVSKGKENTPR